MANAIGGWRGVIDSSLPSGLFLVVYILGGRQLAPAVWAAVLSGLAIAVLRLVRRQSVQQVLSGLHRRGLLRLARHAHRPGRGLLPAGPAHQRRLRRRCSRSRASSATRCSGTPSALPPATCSGWRKVPEQRRAYALATWFFVGVFFLRLLVQVPALPRRRRSRPSASRGSRWAGRCSPWPPSSPSGCITKARKEARPPLGPSPTVRRRQRRRSPRAGPPGRAPGRGRRRRGARRRPRRSRRGRA